MLSPVAPRYETSQASTFNLRQPIPKCQKFNLRYRVYLQGIGILTDLPLSVSVKNTLRFDLLPDDEHCWQTLRV